MRPPKNSCCSLLEDRSRQYEKGFVVIFQKRQISQKSLGKKIALLYFINFHKKKRNQNRIHVLYVHVILPRGYTSKLVTNIEQPQLKLKLESQGPFTAHLITKSKQFSQKKDNQNERIQINECVVGNKSVCCCEPLVWRRILSKEKPFRYLFLPRPRSTPWNIWPKQLQEWHHSK